MLETVSLRRKALVGESRPRGRPQKNLLPVQPALLEPVPAKITGDVIEVNESQSKGHEIVMSITESSSKIHRPKLYEKAVNDPVHGQRWREALEEELQNLENY